MLRKKGTLDSTENLATLTRTESHSQDDFFSR